MAASDRRHADLTEELRAAYEAGKASAAFSAQALARGSAGAARPGAPRPLDKSPEDGWHH
ncbi:MAG TPA: hypothetical protein VD902_12420 [Symbiobacteriaceae bacterium]|nr:hypothetical protein [Symbiobacteriaceae bacterium]